MASNRHAVVRRAIGEFLIIFVGVVVALRFEDLRDQREARAKETAALEALADDLSETLDGLRGNVERQRRWLEAQRALLNISEGHRPEPAPDSVAGLVARAFRFERLEAVTGSYDALMNAGDMRLIRNDTLRASLAALFGSMGEGFEDEDLSTLARNEFLMAISGTMTLRGATGTYYTGWLGLDGPPPAGDPSALLGDRGFLTALTTMALAEYGQIVYFRRVERALSAVIKMIKVELENA